MHEYYAQRAKNYDEIYRSPERQADQQDLSARLAASLQDRQVLEIGCGTGYWTERYAGAAVSVLATDINPAMLEVARAKAYPAGKVQFALADAADIPQGEHNACFTGFFWSQVKREEQAALLDKWRARVGKGCLLVMVDDNYVEGRSRPVARTDAEGNTYQTWQREDGSWVELVKNFPTDSFLRKKLAATARDIRIYRNTHFWMLSCTLK